MATNLLGALSRLYASRNRRHRRALANLARAMPERSAEDHQAIASAMWDNVGRVIAEAIHVDRLVAEPHRLDVLDMRILDEYVARRGVYILASLHTANWEIGILPSSMRGFTPAAFYRAVSNPYVDRYLKASREKICTGGLFAVRSDGGGLGSAEITSRQMVDCLRKKVPICILADHYDPQGILVPFFGQNVRVSRVPATLAYRFGSPLCAARTIRVGRETRFIGEAREMELPRTGNLHADIEAATRAVFRQFETWIRQYPDQWLWSQAPFLMSSEVYNSPSSKSASGQADSTDLTKASRLSTEHRRRRENPEQ